MGIRIGKEITKQGSQCIIDGKSDGFSYSFRVDSRFLEDLFHARLLYANNVFL